MSTTYQLTFRGEIYPGHDPHIVRSRMASALKISAEQVEAIFSGRRVVLRKGLPETEVERYVRHLELLGVRVYAEPLPTAKVVPPAAPPVAAAPSTPPQAKPELALTERAEAMVCPNCGERQPRRNLCRACAIDMKRFAEAKVEAIREEREERIIAAEEARANRLSPGAGEGAAGMFGVGFDGRIGRGIYLLGSFMSMALLMLALQFLIRGPIGLFFLGVAASAFMSIRLMALRCHDRGWSGWMGLLVLIPYLGWLFGLVLTLLPGEQAENRFGAPGRGAGMPMAAGVMALFCACSLLTFRNADTRAQTLAMMAGKVPAAQAQAAVHANPNAEVEIFTTATCPTCWVAKDYLQSRGISYYERDLETDIPARDEFYARGGTAVPYIFVNGRTMTGFDADAFERLRRE